MLQGKLNSDDCYGEQHTKSQMRQRDPNFTNQYPDDIDIPRLTALIRTSGAHFSIGTRLTFARRLHMDFIIILIIAGIVAMIMCAVNVFNTLPPLREQVYEAISNIRTAVEKRSRVLETLIQFATDYAKHEQNVHAKISADFNSPPQIPADPAKAFAYVSRLVNTFPDLKADRTYLSLMNELNTLEAGIQLKYETHNARVREYNSARQSFPNCVFAEAMGFKLAEYRDSVGLLDNK